VILVMNCRPSSKGIIAEINASKRGITVCMALFRQLAPSLRISSPSDPSITGQ
jgi:hypothetical protein